MNHAPSPRDEAQCSAPVAIIAAAAEDDDVEQQQQQTVGLTSAFRIQTALIAELERAIAEGPEPAERARLERLRREAVMHATQLIGRAVAETMRQQQVLSAEVDDAVRIAMAIEQSQRIKRLLAGAVCGAFIAFIVVLCTHTLWKN